MWSDEKNSRRCNLIDKQLDGKLSFEEALELEDLQNQMLEYRKRVAPRFPIEIVDEL